MRAGVGYARPTLQILMDTQSLMVSGYQDMFMS